MFSFTFLHNGFDHVLFSTIVENSVAYHLSLNATFKKIFKGLPEVLKTDKQFFTCTN